jgi:hypothetical protein
VDFDFLQERNLNPQAEACATGAAILFIGE